MGTNDANSIRENIKKRVLRLERENYAQKPNGGLKDNEMVERIKKIIEQEVDR